MGGSGERGSQDRGERAAGPPDLREYLKDENLDCFGDQSWEELADHVKVHKYYLDRRAGGKTDTPWQEALESWYRTIYRPLKDASDSEEVSRAFPEMECGELYLGVSHHWLFMKQYEPNATPAQAAHDFVIRYGEGLERWYRRVDDPGLT